MMGNMKYRTFLIPALALTAILSAGAAVIAFAFPGHTPLRMVAGGESMSSVDAQDAQEAIQKAWNDTTVAITYDGTTSVAHLDELGVELDAARSAQESTNVSPSQRLASVFSPSHVSVVYTVDEGTLNSFLESVGVTPAKNAEVVKSDDEFTVQPGSAGQEVSDESLGAIRSIADTLTSGSVSLTTAESSPAVSDDDAQSVADQANAKVSSSVAVDGESPDTSTRMSWVGTDASVDSEAVGKWVGTLAESKNVSPSDGIRNMSGQEVAQVVTQAVDGRTVSNSDQITSDLVASLDSASDYSASFEFETVAAKWAERPVAAGASALAYHAADGEKWVDVNLSTYTVTAYEGATVVYGPVAMVPGATATPTVTGTFHVYLKYASQTMRGANADGSRYVTPDVPWVSYFTGGYALHGAPWRSSFGYGGSAGSHGCVNMPVSAAKWVYDWAPIGTPVTVHN